ncbi:hypothetical protein DPV87_09225 [Haemophilus parainfluenzae]|jgi:hypothetical protein|uniref:RiboL-PSP-HEPN domain-containing protein n=1 Tax=Haemophilus parainfluenzae TaxID=729 RepID=A0A369Z076_HAEPA|nr:MAE_28990/MAE_18760 family HEPN-like nuclease [Haemophilus parainfluenzae]RDE89448.1 hypothetical protein DPV87_09225 [Haemophilus parainfluenzae]
MKYEKLEKAINNDLSWRRQEFTEFNFLLQDDELSPYRKEVMLKASIALLYSHWEGHIKFSARKYIEYISEQKLPVGDLTENFKQIFLPAYFCNHTLNLKNIKSQQMLHDFFQENESLFKVDSEKTILTNSNLNSDLATEILMQLGFDNTLFDSNKTFIDEQLLASRNAISHGDKTSISKHNLNNIYDQIKIYLLKMLESFDEQILDSASNKLYLRTNQSG